jgi:hypothetical protein
MTTGTLHAPCSTMAQIKVLLVEGNEGDTRRTPVDDVLQLLSPQTIQKNIELVAMVSARVPDGLHCVQSGIDDCLEQAS